MKPSFPYVTLVVSLCACVSNRSQDAAASTLSRLYVMKVVRTAAKVPRGMEKLGFFRSPAKKWPNVTPKENCICFVKRTLTFNLKSAKTQDVSMHNLHFTSLFWNRLNSNELISLAGEKSLLRNSPSPFSGNTTQAKTRFPLIMKVLEGPSQHLTRHVGARHDSSAAIEHDGKHFDKTHHGTSCIVNCVAGFENKERSRGTFEKFQIQVKSTTLHSASWQIWWQWIVSPQHCWGHIWHLRNRLLVRVRSRMPV